MRLRAVVPRLEDGGHRDRLWRFCRRYWSKQMPDMEIVEGHHQGDGPFNRSAAINQAAEGDWDVLVILDSDVIVDVGAVRAGVERAAESGDLVLPFRRRQMLSAQGTRQILRGYQGSWRRWIATSERNRVSCCVIVPRALWDAVGGFDELFEGWGGEDEAFYYACRTLADSQRLPGDVWHLHHAPSPHHDRRSPLYRQALRLCERYERADGDDLAMRRLLAEPHTPDQIALVLLTTGRRETLVHTIKSAEENLQGPIGRRLIVVSDLSAKSAAETVARDYPGWEVEAVRGGSYPAAMRGALQRAVGCGQRWVFWLEDDFTFNGPVDLGAMQALMESNPNLAQLALLRQPWYPHEMEAGGLFAAKPGTYTQCDGYVEHQDHWTCNPMLVRRELLAAFEWPKGLGSEKRFGDEVYSTGLSTGILGRLEDPPQVEHIGVDQAGTGY